MVSGKWSWDTAHETTGSGIVIVKMVNEEYRPLGLWAYGGYDIPKGHVEKGDDIFDTAIREAIEEADITDFQFLWGRERHREDNLFVYLAATNQEPKILFNKEENLYEHEFANWVTWSEMKNKCYGYLLPVIKWAEHRVLQ